MLREGLFSSEKFSTAAAGFVLLRLKPGPAEAEFGITAAPMAAIADWHGRVTNSNLSLRGDIDRACQRLTQLLKSFDRKRAGRPLYTPPTYAQPLLRKDNEKAMLAFLRRKPGNKQFDDFIKVYQSLDTEVDLINFCNNYINACEKRRPKPGKEHGGYAQEYGLLEMMTWCRNDRIKFRAIQGYARFAPLKNISFFANRAAKRRVGCRNPNLILCRAMEGIGIMAGRVTKAEDHRLLLSTLPDLAATLRTEGRNNGACKLASTAIVTICETTGAPQALATYLLNFKPPTPNNDWLRKYTDRYFQRCLPWLQEKTGQDFGADYDAWKNWYSQNSQELYFHPRKQRFVRDRKAAEGYRKKMGK